MPYKILTLASVAFTAAGSLVAQSTWTGANSSTWNTSGNWDDGVPSTSKGAIFDDASAVPNMPITDTTQRQADGVTFNQAGWTIGSDGPGYLNLRGTNPVALVSNGAGTNTIAHLRTFQASTVTTGAGNTLQVLNSNGGLNFTTKSGSGTFAIGGTATVSTMMNVTAGSLLIQSTGSYSANSLDSIISSGALLGGNGSLGTRAASTIEFVSGATFAPGELGIGDVTAGTFTIDAPESQAVTQEFDAHLQTGSTFAIDIFADGSSDKALFSGVGGNTRTAMNIENGVTVALSGTPQFSTAYRIAEFIEAGQYDASYGTFSTVTLNGNTLTEGVDFTIDYTDHVAFTGGTGGIDITLINIPEPQTYAMVALIGLSALIMRRRR